MKKSRLIAIVAGVLVLTVAIGAGTYAWFMSSSDALKGNASAARISLKDNETQIINVDDVLPGEKIDFGTNQVIYDGTREAIIEFTLAGEAFLNGDPTSHEDWDGAFASDYALVNGRWTYSEARIAEILKVNMSGVGSVNIQASTSKPNTYYAFIDVAPSTVNLASELDVVFAGEFGGLAGGSPSRQFEQESKFENLGLSVTAVQVTADALDDVLGAGTSAEIAALFPAAANLSSWIAN